MSVQVCWGSPPHCAYAEVFVQLPNVSVPTEVLDSIRYLPVTSARRAKPPGPHLPYTARRRMAAGARVRL